VVDRYPEAIWAGDGVTYGPLPDSGWGREDVRVVLHTTETGGMPGYNNGANAPHLTYAPESGIWTQHADLDKRVGTDKSYGNPMSIAVELIAYSDGQLADRRGHLWVGDFTDEHYRDLAAFLVWLQTGPWPELRTHELVYGPSVDFPTFLYGSGASTRLSKSEWEQLGGGLTGHGASPSGSTHWDTGELDLWKLSELVKEEMEPEAPSVDLITFGDAGAVVQFWAAILSYRGRSIEPQHSEYDQTFADALLEELPNGNSRKLTGRQGAMIMDRLWG
jgi:hypothetical protein